ncbi:23S rRNA (uracil(1939)-C(5))-methyltransferase RlmD [Bacteroidota bacterium]
MGRKKNYPLLENIEILELASGGKSLAKIDNLVVFVTNDAVPGDIVDLQIKKKRKNYYEAFPVNFIKLSENRVTPICEYFGTCGGCKWQNFKYTEQVKHKEKQVYDQISRIGKAVASRINPIILAENTEYYRNKLEFTFSNKRWITKKEVENKTEIKEKRALGFHIPGRFDKILDIEKCYLQKDPSNDIRQAIKKFAIEGNFEFFDLIEQKGFLRNLIVRTTSNNEVMVIVSFFQDDKLKIKKLLTFLKDEIPGLTSIMYVINSKGNDTISDLDIRLFYGQDYITEILDGLKFKIGPKSFFQTNYEQALKLYRITKDYAKLSGKEIVYDLYTGTGTIANFVAKDARKVIGIEYIEDAIEDARENSKINKIKNTEFVAGDIKDLFTINFMAKYGKPDVVILDPPRAGVHADIIKNIIFALPSRIVYISCNPATQARDIALLNNHYGIRQIQPIDMFPHTHHVENIVLLEKY